jgi:hypothetical protein
MHLTSAVRTTVIAAVPHDQDVCIPPERVCHPAVMASIDIDLTEADAVPPQQQQVS